ncbi:hypothetical protein ACH42_00215 [Endozoicomonas sp. (ex Bugula neritina AB1)]|nr:hypothetical protein ACH42_00215 [Endozoicomonas sp. (ex Bugula neritina AB1)]
MLNFFLREHQHSNVSISPQGLWQLLNMIYKGAIGYTKELLDQYLQGFTPSTNLKSINDLVIREGITIDEDFRQKLESLGAEVQSVDFQDLPCCKAAAEKINKRTAEATNDMITHAIEPDCFGRYSVALLVNTIYFNKNWENKFELNGTIHFTTAMSQVKPVEAMCTDIYTRYTETIYAQAVALPYINSNGTKTEMIVIVPKDSFKPACLSLEQMAELLNKMKSSLIENVLVKMPAFRIESDLMELRGPLCSTSMGLEALFKKVSMKMGGAYVKDEFHISDMTQKVVIEVDEKGTEAAAVTCAMMTDGLNDSQLPKKVTCDKPFMYMIVDYKDEQSELDILFAGQVADPTNRG